jgi:hypothetical protein
MQLTNIPMYQPQQSPSLVSLPTAHPVTETGIEIGSSPPLPNPNDTTPESDDNKETPTSTATATTTAAAAAATAAPQVNHSDIITDPMMMMKNHSNPKHLSSSSPSSSLSLPPSEEIRNNIPKGMVWLASFPNSGTTYTISIVRSMTNASTATNYGGNERDTTENSWPVLFDCCGNDGSDDEEDNLHARGGPYYRSPKQLPLVPYRDAHIITKTHCNRRISGTVEHFIQMCATGTKYDNGKIMRATYSNDQHVLPSRLSGIVYLVRNPYTNIIARMNYQRKEWLQSSDPIDHQRASFFPKNNRTGFYLWCQYKDRKRSAARTQLMAYQNGTFYRQYLQSVPCFVEFYLYFQWHNMANEMIPYARHYRRNLHNNSSSNSTSPNIMMIYYEDYDRPDARTAIVEPLLFDMLHFTPDQIVNSTIPQFVSEKWNHTNPITDTIMTDQNHTHHPHSVPTTDPVVTNLIIRRMYTPEQQRAIKQLAQVMTTPQTWSVLQHYFEEI